MGRTHRPIADAPERDDSLAHLLYDQVLVRYYQGIRGEQVLLLIAHGPQQTDALQLHRPEACYAAVGYTINATRRAFDRSDANRSSPDAKWSPHLPRAGSVHISYWTRIGDELPDDETAQRAAIIHAAIKGQIVDGTLARVSNVRTDPGIGTQTNVAFITELLRAMAPQDRAVLIGVRAARLWNGDMSQNWSLPIAQTIRPARRAVPLELIAWAFRLVEAVVVAAAGSVSGMDRHLIAVALLLYPSFASLSGNYDMDSLFSPRRAAPRLINAWVASVLFIVAFQILLNSRIPLMVRPALFWAINTSFALVAVRSILGKGAQTLRLRGHFNHRLAIYGATAPRREALHHIMKHEAHYLDLLGVYDERHAARLDAYIALLPFRGNIDTLVADIRAGVVDQVIIALPWSELIYLRSVISRLTLTPVRIRLAPDEALLAYPQRPIVMLGRSADDDALRAANLWPRLNRQAG